MAININKVLQADAERKARPAPVPKIKMKSALPVAKNETVIVTVEIDRDEPSKKDLLIAELEKEYTVIKKDRAQISTRCAHLVKEIEEGLRKESPAMADEFLSGNIPMPELAEQYRQIASITDDQLAPLYDKINHVKMYGELPVAIATQEVTVNESEDAKALKYEIRRLDDLIYKTNTKLKNAKGGLKVPKNSDRVNEWREIVSKADSKREELKMKLKNIQYGARG